MSETIKQLASLLRQRNQIDAQIAALIDRPATVGHIGEFVASRIFGISLETAATNPGHDGRFESGPLAGRTVNVKAYGRREGLLDINPVYVPDYFLVMTGPKASNSNSVGQHRPWIISEVFLFDAQALIDVLRARGTKIGVATSVPASQWEKARIFPPSPSAILTLSDSCVRLLELFGEQNAEDDKPFTC